MTKEECAQLWDLMGVFWPNSPRLADRKTMRAYWYALEPYTYEDAKNAVLVHARRQGSYFPDVSDITGRIVVADDEPKESWDRPETVDGAREIIACWARLYGFDVPVMHSIAEYYGWWREKRKEVYREDVSGTL